MKQSLRSYFEITKKEWNGMVIMLVLIVVIVILPYAIHYFRAEPKMDLTNFNKAAAQLNKQKDTIGTPLFKFDPNNLSAKQWLKLGLTEKQTSVIQNYISKGGRFYHKTDLQKIYSITPEDYKRLEPYIDLPGQYVSAKTDGVVEINAADSAKLTQVKGIGAGFASRIIKYRAQLGGFYKKEQLMEVYGIDSAKYHELAPLVSINPARIHKIQINKVTIDELRPFPYFNFKQMSAIIEYRKQHGDYHSMSDLKQIAILDDEILRKIAPYLSFK